jgi:hypothetical protein
MANTLRGIVGISLASIICGFRRGWREFRYASHDTTNMVRPFETADMASLPVRTFEELIGDRAVTIELPLQRHEDGALPWTDAVALLSLMKLAAPSVVLEIGTFFGIGTRAMARNLPEATIHTLDLPLDYKAENDPVTEIPKDDAHLIARREPGRNFIGTPEAARIRQHFGDSAIWDYSQAAGATCFFIDGSHTYEYAKVDSEKCYELCGGKGVFFWHDCNDLHPGVVKFLAEWRRLGRNIVHIRQTQLAYWDSRL